MKKPTKRDKYLDHVKKQNAEKTEYLFFYIDGKEVRRVPLYKKDDYEQAVADFKKEYGPEVRFLTQTRLLGHE